MLRLAQTRGKAESRGLTPTLSSSEAFHPKFAWGLQLLRLSPYSSAIFADSAEFLSDAEMADEERRKLEQRRELRRRKVLENAGARLSKLRGDKEKQVDLAKLAFL